MRPTLAEKLFLGAMTLAALVAVACLVYVSFFKTFPLREPHVTCPKCGERLEIDVVGHKGPVVPKGDG